VKIKFGWSSINRLNDKEYLMIKKYIILYDGKIKDNMMNIYGENDFLIYVMIGILKL